MLVSIAPVGSEGNRGDAAVELSQGTQEIHRVWPPAQPTPCPVWTPSKWQPGVRGSSGSFGLSKLNVDLADIER